MRVILDTHTLIWIADDDSRLASDARALVEDPSTDLLISAATIWEIAIKCGSGKLSLAGRFRPWIESIIAALEAEVLPITVEYADAQSTLPPHHRDPFDRLIVAQALVEGSPIVGIDRRLDDYGVRRIW